jgi:hypothetical protein
MSDRTNVITVVLEKEIRVDESKRITDAICMIRGVLSAEPEVADFSDHMHIQRARHEIGAKLFDIIYPKTTP